MKHFIDPVWGHIEYDDIIFKIVDTEEFQRLRNIKQLGASCWTFPSATHTRFEHCLGVCHLVDKIIYHLQINSNNNVTVRPFLRICTMLAGLLHDIGHGPFSHMWESFVRANCPDEWHHEDASCDMTRALFKNNDNIQLSLDPVEHHQGIEIICALIIGDLNKLRTYLTPDEMFLTEIVNNKYCLIDVDKWDYIIRDSFYLNNVISIPRGFELAFKGARVTRTNDGETHISFHHKHYALVCEIFQNRSKLHMQCYKHSTTLSVEELLKDIFEAAEDAGFLFKGMKLSEAHRNTSIYTQLNDTIIEYIGASDDPNLLRAQQLIRRLKQRDLYQLVCPSSNKGITLNGAGEYFKKQQYVNGAAPTTILFHDDSGSIVNLKQDLKQCTNNYNQEDYLIFSKKSSKLLA